MENHYACLMAKSNYFYGYVLCRKLLNDLTESQEKNMKLDMVIPSGNLT